MLTVSDNHIVLGGGGGSGDVVGAASSTNNAVAKFEGATGKIIKNSALIIADDGSASLASSSSGYPTLSLSTTANWSGSNYGLFVSGYTMLGGVRINGADAQRSFYLSAGTMGFATGSSPITFTTSVSAERMRIGENGNVVIGDTSATAKLDVNGTFRSRGTATFNGQIIDNVGSSGTDGQILKKVGGLVIWANP